MKSIQKAYINTHTYIELPGNLGKKEVKRRVDRFKEALERKRYYKKEKL